MTASMDQNRAPDLPKRRMSRLTVILCYAHRDERLREELDKHLSGLRRGGLIQSWHDRRIIPGSDLDPEINQHLRSCDLILLLISPDFIDSDYCYRREMRAALKRHAKGEARVIPIILRPVDWRRTPVGRLLALPRDGKPVTTWHRRDEALLDVANGVRMAAEEVIARRRSNLPLRANGKPGIRLAALVREP